MRVAISIKKKGSVSVIEHMYIYVLIAKTQSTSMLAVSFSPM